MSMAVDDEALTGTPCRVKRVGTDLTPKRNYLDQDDLNAPWDERSPDMRFFLMVVYGGALRSSEALGLDRRHGPDLATGHILVEQQVQLVKGKGSVIVPWTEKGESRVV